MRSEVVEVIIKNIVTTPKGVALFLGNNEKTFIIYVDLLMGEQITSCQQARNVTRPLTYDFIRNLCFGFDIEVQHIVITDMKEGIFFARVLLKQQCEGIIKIVELDSRPSDAILLALTHKKPLWVDRGLFQDLPDVKDLAKNWIKD
jgi:bifunctional DNase/RNase